MNYCKIAKCLNTIRQTIPKYKDNLTKAPTRNVKRSTNSKNFTHESGTDAMPQITYWKSLWPSLSYYIKDINQSFPKQCSIVGFTQTRFFCSATSQSDVHKSVHEEKHRRKSPTSDELQKVISIFPTPKYSLNHVYLTLSQTFSDKGYMLNPKYQAHPRGGKNSWECSYMLQWPEKLKFSAIGTNKQDASTKAAVAALYYLYSNKHITDKNLPVLPEKEAEMKAELRKIESLYLQSDTVNLMQEIINEYENNMIKQFECDGQEIKPDNASKSLEKEWPIIHPGTYNIKFKGEQFYKCKEEKILPISDFKQTIIDTVKSNRVVIIKGEPGCGKSTRVPQYLLEGWAQHFQETGENCRIIVTQPRRIAAISLAERVASERSELAGPTIGYQVRLKSNFNKHTGRILYCTTGILLRRLQSDPNLTDCTHVILDEAHERDVNTDLLMNLIKRAMKVNENLKLLVMSATIKADVFQQYFDDAAIVHVPGFTYPVTVNYLNQLPNLDATMRMATGNTPTVVCEDVVKLINNIHTTRPEGAILVFLPGWEEIQRVKRLLRELRIRNTEVLCVHSRMPDSEQRLIFHTFPPGIRKIILATNIAETSVTIDDVVYVIDTGIHKERNFDAEKGINVIDQYWIAKSSMEQRKGRAGRVQPGEAFLLYPKEKFAQFIDYGIPEIQRTSLTKIVLDSKVYSNNMKAADFLGELITPPDKAAIDLAVEELTDLDCLSEDENLTSLGRVISNFQLEPKLAKAMVNSVIYKCVTPITDIITFYSSEMEIFASALSERELVVQTRKKYSQSSDHLSMMRLFEEWLHLSETSYSQSTMFSEEHNIVEHKLKTLQKLREIHFDYLNKDLHGILPLSDEYADNDELVKAVLLSGVGTLLQHRDHDYVKGRLKKKNVLLTRNNHKATISGDSVNQRRSNWPANYLLYINETRSNIRRTTVIRETSLITPLAVILFKNNDIVIESTNHKNTEQDSFSDPVVVRLKDTNIAFVTEKENALLLQRCKESMNSIVDYYIYQLTHGAEYDKNVNDIWYRILNRLDGVLKGEAGNIGY